MPRMMKGMCETEVIFPRQMFYLLLYDFNPDAIIPRSKN